MKLEGLKANFLGDSITEGHGVSTHENVYHQVIARKYGLATARNYGISGTRLAKQTTPSATASWDLDFCSRFADMDDDADFVVVFGGTNDFCHGDAPLGRMSDRTPDSFYGACHTLMRGLIEKYPGKPIVFMTPLHRLCEERSPDFPHVEYALIDYVNAIKEVAAYYSLPVIDLWAVSGIQPNVPIIMEKYCPDGLHPNDAGHALMAERIAGALLAL